VTPAWLTNFVAACGLALSMTALGGLRWRLWGSSLSGDAENARPENDGQTKVWVWKMQDWKMTDKLLANCEHN